MLNCLVYQVPRTVAASDGVYEGANMTGNLVRVLFIVVMIAIIVSVDLLFLRHHFTARLLVNIGIVLVFVLVYFVSFKKS